MRNTHLNTIQILDSLSSLTTNDDDYLNVTSTEESFNWMGELTPKMIRVMEVITVLFVNSHRRTMLYNVSAYL